jgi:hypothetical protein
MQIGSPLHGGLGNCAEDLIAPLSKPEVYGRADQSDIAPLVAEPALDPVEAGCERVFYEGVRISFHRERKPADGAPTVLIAEHVFDFIGPDRKFLSVPPRPAPSCVIGNA